MFSNFAQAATSKLLPDDTASQIVNQVTAGITANAGIMLTLLGFGVLVTFVFRWLNKSAKKIRP